MKPGFVIHTSESYKGETKIKHVNPKARNVMARNHKIIKIMSALANNIIILICLQHQFIALCNFFASSLASF